MYKHWKWNAGGASGIGLETARVLALRNAHVIIGARNMESAKEAKQVILRENESARVDILKLDLCSMNSVRTFVNNFIALALPLNILMCFHSPTFSLNPSVFWFSIFTCHCCYLLSETMQESCSALIRKQKMGLKCSLQQIILVNIHVFSIIHIWNNSSYYISNQFLLWFFNSH